LSNKLSLTAFKTSPSTFKTEYAHSMHISQIQVFISYLQSS